MATVEEETRFCARGQQGTVTLWRAGEKAWWDTTLIEQEALLGLTVETGAPVYWGKPEGGQRIGHVTNVVVARLLGEATLFFEIEESAGEAGALLMGAPAGATLAPCPLTCVICKRANPLRRPPCPCLSRSPVLLVETTPQIKSLSFFGKNGDPLDEPPLRQALLDAQYRSRIGGIVL